VPVEHVVFPVQLVAQHVVFPVQLVVQLVVVLVQHAVFPVQVVVQLVVVPVQLVVQHVVFPVQLVVQHAVFPVQHVVFPVEQVHFQLIKYSLMRHTSATNHIQDLQKYHAKLLNLIQFVIKRNYHYLHKYYFLIHKLVK